jgi:hypothetical protein
MLRRKTLEYIMYSALTTLFYFFIFLYFFWPVCWSAVCLLCLLLSAGLFVLARLLCFFASLLVVRL